MINENKTDNRLPIDPAKLTVGEAYEYADTLGVWREWEIETSEQLRQVQTQFDNRLKFVRAAQPPIESLRPGDVVEIHWRGNATPNQYALDAQRCIGTSRTRRSVVHALDGSLINGWRLVYRAENIPNSWVVTGVDVHTKTITFDRAENVPQPDMVVSDGTGQQWNVEHKMTSRAENAPQEASDDRRCDVCGQALYKLTSVLTGRCRDCQSRVGERPFNWADLKPGDEFEVNLVDFGWAHRVIAPSGVVLDRNGERRMPSAMSYAGIGVAGRWPVNKPTQTMQVTTIGDEKTGKTFAAGSAVSSKPATTPAGRLLQRWAADVIEKASKPGSRPTPLGRFMRDSERKAAAAAPTERIIPWDGRDRGVLVEGAILQDDMTKARRTIVKAPTLQDPWMELENLPHGNVSKAYCTEVNTETEMYKLARHSVVQRVAAKPPTKPACNCASQITGKSTHNDWCNIKEGE